MLRTERVAYVTWMCRRVIVALACGVGLPVVDTPPALAQWATPRTDSPVSAADAARAAQAEGDLALTQGNPEAAEAAFLRELAFCPDVVPYIQQCTWSATSRLGLLYYRKGDFTQAERFARQDIAAAEAVFGPSSPQALMQTRLLAQIQAATNQTVDAEANDRHVLDAALAAQPVDTTTVASATSDLLVLLVKKGRAAEAVAVGVHGLNVLRGAGDTSSSGYLSLVLNVGRALDANQQRTDAAPYLQEAVALIAARPGHLDAELVITLNDLGLSLLLRGDATAAVVAFRRALTLAAVRRGAGDPTVLTEKANLASALIKLDDHLDEAETLDRQVLAAREASSDHYATAEALAALGEVLRVENRLADARKALETGLAGIERGANANEIFRTRLSLAGVYIEQGHPGDAAPLLDAAMASVTANPQLDQSDNLRSLMIGFDGVGRHDQARDIARQLLAKTATTKGINSLAYAEALDDSAHVAMTSGHLRDAVVQAKHALDVSSKLAPAHSDPMIRAQYQLAEMERAAGDVVPAETLYRSVIADGRALPKPADVSPAMNALTVLLYDSGRYAEADLVTRQVLDPAQSGVRPQSVNAADAMANLASLDRRFGKLRDAEPLAVQARDIDARLADSSVGLAGAWRSLGLIYDVLGRDVDAELALRRALEMQLRIQGPNTTDTALTLQGLAGVLADRGKATEAALLIDQAGSVVLALRGPQDPALVWVWILQGRLALRSGHLDLASRDFVQARSIAHAVFGARSVKLTPPMVATADLLDARGDPAGALAVRLDALNLLELAYGKQSAGLAGTLIDIAFDYQRLGQIAAAMAALDRAELLLASPEAGTTALAPMLLDVRGLALAADGHLDLATADLAKAANLTAALRGAGTPAYAQMLNGQGYVMVEAGNFKGAEGIFLKGLSVARQAHADAVTKGALLLNLARALKGEGRAKEGAVIAARGLGMLREMARPVARAGTSL